MTIQSLIDAIAEALFQEFGSDYEIYTEKVEQGLKEPCFLIRALNPTKNVYLDWVYKRTNPFVIQYFPSTLDAIAECHSVSERLFECLEDVIIVDKPIRGRDLNAEIKDGILNFTVNYDGFVRKLEEQYLMEDLEIETDARG
jgi:hypothetical protein